MRLLFLPSLFFLLFQNILSQNLITLRDDFRGVYISPTQYGQRYEIEEGSPYLNLEFAPAKIGDREKTYLVRFNVYEGSVEVWIQENKVIELNNSSDERITMLDGSNTEYVITTYLDPKGDLKKGFLEELKVSNSYTLYKKENVKYFKKVKAGAYKEEQPARFETAPPQFYFKLVDDDATIRYLSNNKKKFLSIFDPQNADKVKALIKKEKLSLTKKEDIIRILEGIYGG
ncbi:MAG: hypothetical protein AAF717_05010 [Bacteroidota bacterium]